MSAHNPVLPLCLAAWCALAVLAPLPVRAQEAPGDAAHGAPPSGARYFLSNELGMALQEIGWYRREEAEFVLVIRAQAGQEVRTLLKQGREIKRWEVEGREERVYENGELAERTRLDPQGRRLELWEYQAGSLIRRTEFAYSRAGQISARCYDGEGNLLYTDRSLLSVDKGLREVRRESAQGESSRLGLSMSGDHLVEERAGGGGRTLIKRYDTRGRLIERERWAEDRLAERESLRYVAEAETPAASTVVDYLSGDTTVRTYDDTGYLRHVEVQRDGKLVEQTHYERDGQGRTTLATKRGAAGLEQWRYEYDEEGELLREEYRLRGSLERVTRYEAEGRSVEELYRDGSVFMRIAYQDGEKVREEFLSNGTVVRTREFR